MHAEQQHVYTMLCEIVRVCVCVCIARMENYVPLHLQTLGRETR